MLDPAWLRDHLDEAATRLADRGVGAALQEFGASDAERRRILAESEKLKHQKNQASQKIGALMKEGRKADADAAREEVRGISERIAAPEAALEGVEARVQDLALRIPNMPHPSVPPGRDSADNPILRSWGERPRFDFKPLHHVEIAEQLGILDLEGAAKLSG